MLAAVAIEGLASVLGVPRTEVEAFYDSATEKFTAKAGDVRRQVGSVLARDIPSGERASLLVDLTGSLADDDLRKLAAKLIGGVSATLWGGMVTYAGLNAGIGTTVAVLGLVELMPVIAVILGIVILYFAGSFALDVFKELLNRIRNQPLQQWQF